MRQVETDGVVFGRCPMCSGMHFQKGQLERLLGKPPAELETLNYTAMSDVMDAMRAYCFDCSAQMTARIGAEEVRIDTCGKCGAIFLDQGEYASLKLYHQ